MFYITEVMIFICGVGLFAALVAAKHLASNLCKGILQLIVLLMCFLLLSKSECTDYYSINDKFVIPFLVAYFFVFKEIISATRSTVQTSRT